MSFVNFKDFEPYQRILHEPNGSEAMTSSFFYERSRKLPHFPRIVKTLRSTSSETDYNYCFSPTESYCCNASLSSSTGSFSVKEEFKKTVQIKFARNYGYNMIVKASLKINNEVISEIDPTVCEIMYGYNRNIGDGFWENHERNIGNYRCLLEWTSNLPDKPISFTQPFPGCFSNNKLQLFLFNTSVGINFEYSFLDPKKLIMMRIMKDGEWYEADSNFIEEYFDKYLVYSKQREIPTILLHLQDISPCEVDSFKCSMKNNLHKNKYYGIEYKDIIDSNENVVSKTKLNSVLSHKDNPILAFFFLAKNMQAEEFNNYSNHTIDSFSISSNEIPILDSSLTIDSKIIFDRLTPAQLISSQSQYFKSLPRNYSILSYSISSSPFSDNYEFGKVLKNQAALSCNIRQEFINQTKNIVRFSNKKDVYIKGFNEKPEYKYIVKILVSKNIRIEQDKPDDFNSLQTIKVTWDEFSLPS